MNFHPGLFRSEMDCVTNRSPLITAYRFESLYMQIRAKS
jgi:hypothetical protein